MKIKMAVMAILCTYALCSCMYNDIVSEYNSRKNNDSSAEISDDVLITEASNNESEKGNFDPTEEPDSEDYIGIKYDQLNDDEKAAYNQICEGLENHYSCVLLDIPLQLESLYKAYDAVRSTLESQMYDPTRDSVSISVGDNNLICNVTLEYNFSEDEVAKVKDTLEEAAEKIMELLTDDMTETQKEIIIHDELAKRCRYDDDAVAGSDDDFAHNVRTTHCSDAYGAIVEGKAVCEGYARAFRYLCNRSGIKCELVSGKSSNNVGHMWNIVNVDGAWHQVDVTYDSPPDGESIRHDYLNVSDIVMFQDHTIDEKYFNYPKCT